MELTKETEIRSPFDLSEMLWFILPGAALIISIFLFEYWLNNYIVKDDFRTKTLDSISTYMQSRDTINLKKMDFHEKEWFVKSIKDIPLDGSVQGNRPSKKSVDSTIKVIISGSTNIDKPHMDSLRKEIIGLAAFIDSTKKEIHTPIFSAIMLTRVNDELLKDNWLLSAIYLLFILCACYITGHVLNMWSTIIYQRMFIMKGYGYPFERILNLKNPLGLKHEKTETRINRVFEILNKSKEKVIYEMAECVGKVDKTSYDIASSEHNKTFQGCREVLKSEIDKGFYRGSFFWIYACSLFIYLFLVMFEFTSFGIFIPYTGFYLTDVNLAFMALSLIILIFIIIKSLATDKVNNYDFTNTFQINLLSRHYPWFWNKLARLAKNYLSTQSSFDNLFLTRYGYLFYKIYGLKYKTHHSHNYWFAKLYILENSPNISKQIVYWERIYRFSKSLSAAFAIATIYTTYRIITQELNIDNLGAFYDYEIKVLHFLPLLLLSLNLVTLLYYYYVYDNRYSRLIFRSFIALSTLKLTKEKNH